MNFLENFRSLIMFKKVSILCVLLVTNFQLSAATGDWSIRPYVGISQMSDLDANTNGVGAQDGIAEVELDSGFTAGLGFAYQYTDNFAAELAWEYRSNDSQTTLADGQVFSEGNYASNIFFINGIYSFNKTNNWTPYLGAGLSWVQEVDIDLETNGTEISYSGDGDTGFQVFAGANYDISPRWAVHGEIRYGTSSGIELEGEEGAVGTFSDLDYKPLTFQVGMTYKF